MAGEAQVQTNMNVNFMTYSNDKLKNYIQLWEVSIQERIISPYEEYAQALKENSRRFPQNQAINLMKTSYYSRHPYHTTIEFLQFLDKNNKDDD